MRKNVLITSILIIALFASCKSKQSLTESGEKASSVRHLVKLIHHAEPNFTTMNANSISINVNTGGKKMNVSASLKMEKDSIILLSITPFLGIEMYSVELYPDKWFFYDKINRNYTTNDYDYLLYKFGIDAGFSTFQSLFSARLFSIGEKEVDVKKLRYTPMESNKSKLEFDSRNMKQSTTTYSDHTIEQVALQNRVGSHRLETTYSNYIETKGVNYPRNILLEFIYMDNVELSLNMKIQKATFNAPLKLTPSNPERYTRSTLDQLIQ